MNRQEFIKQLTSSLNGLSQEEKDAAISYYEEFFDDAGPENEQEAINNLGSPKEIAESIMSDSTINEQRGLILRNSHSNDNSTENANENSGEQKSSDNGYNYGNTETSSNSNSKNDAVKKTDMTGMIIAIVILAVTSPIWLSILGGFLSALIAIVISFFAVAVSLGIAGFAAFIVGFIYLFIFPPAGLIIMGSGLVAMGITTLIFIPCVKVTVWSVKQIWKGCKKLFKLVTGKKDGAVQ